MASAYYNEEEYATASACSMLKGRAKNQKQLNIASKCYQACIAIAIESEITDKGAQCSLSVSSCHFHTPERRGASRCSSVHHVCSSFSAKKDGVGAHMLSKK